MSGGEYKDRRNANYKQVFAGIKKLLTGTMVSVGMFLGMHVNMSKSARTISLDVIGLEHNFTTSNGVT